MIQAVQNNIHPVYFDTLLQKPQNLVQEQYEVQNTSPVVLEPLIDQEAQEALSAVGHDLSVETDNALSVHSGLDLSRVMSLLEGL